MSRIIDGTTIVTYQGDTCYFGIKNLILGTKIYMSVRDKKYNQLVFPELLGTADEDGDILFEITPAMSNKLHVKSGEPFAIYYYGFKIVDPYTNEEHTIRIKNTELGSKYKLKVYSKRAEGVYEDE